MRNALTVNQLRTVGRFGMVLAFAMTTPLLPDAFLDVDLSHLSGCSLGHAFRTGTPQMAAPQFLSAISGHPLDNRAARLGVPAYRAKLYELRQKI